MYKPTFVFRLGSLVSILMLLSLVSPSVRAQTGPDLLVKPWPEKEQFFDGSADGYFYNAGHLKDTHNAFQLFDYESTGRFRILPGNEISPRLGYDVTFLDTHSHNKQVPDQLSDESIAIGTGIAKWDKWVAGITLGVGYAGTSAFDVGSGWYGKADLVVAREINDNDAVGFILDYDGHRTYLPDVPLPGVGFSHRFDPKLQMVAGIPFSSVSWKPVEHVDLELQYYLLQDFKASLGYEFIKGWTAFGKFDFIRDAFETPGLGKDHRLLFYERRVGIGHSVFTQ